MSPAVRRLLNHGSNSFCGRLLLCVLWLPAQLYGFVVQIRSIFYRSGLRRTYRSPVPVISVGNLTTGGTGKTPVVDDLVKRLLARNLRVAVVSRGYGGSFRGEVGRVSDGGGTLLMTPSAAGDEPCLLAERNPRASVYVARQRRLGVAAAVVDGARCVVLDDGFQHLAVARDLDIVLLDARRPFGNGRLLPAGILREPITALQRADLIVLTHAVADGPIPREVDGPIVTCGHRMADQFLDSQGRQNPWSVVANQPCLAFAGIAHPDDFFAGLRDKGIELAGAWALADHQDYSPALLSRLACECDNGYVLITTEKDAVKLRELQFERPFFSVPLELSIGDEAPLERAIDAILNGVRS